MKKKLIVLKRLNLNKDITEDYKKWMNDLEVQKYTEQKYFKHTINSIKKFVRDKNNSKKEFLYGIFLKDKKKHIGNIKLGPIDNTHKNASISYFIGEKKLWNKGYATLAIKEILKIAKKKGLKKIKAGLYEMNIQSKKVLTKNGFKLEGIFKSEIIYNRKRFNSYWFGRTI